MAARLHAPHLGADQLAALKIGFRRGAYRNQPSGASALRNQKQPTVRQRFYPAGCRIAGFAYMHGGDSCPSRSKNVLDPIAGSATVTDDCPIGMLAGGVCFGAGRDLLQQVPFGDHGSRVRNHNWAATRPPLDNTPLDPVHVLKCFFQRQYITQQCARGIRQEDHREARPVRGHRLNRKSSRSQQERATRRRYSRASDRHAHPLVLSNCNCAQKLPIRCASPSPTMGNPDRSLVPSGPLIWEMAEFEGMVDQKQRRRTGEPECRSESARQKEGDL